MTINEAFSNGKLSTRAYNVCIRNRIFTIDELKDFYQNNSSFERLYLCGAGTNKELITLCENYSPNSENNIIGVIIEMDNQQKEEVNRFIARETETLSSRAQNSIKAYLQNNLKIESFYLKIYCVPTFSLDNLKNAGKKSQQELNVYLKKISDYIFEVGASLNNSSPQPQEA